jgi:hypothetical protein
MRKNILHKPILSVSTNLMDWTLSIGISMKKAVAEHYLKGGIFRESAGFILKEDLPRYGQRRYWIDFQKKFPSP